MAAGTGPTSRRRTDTVEQGHADLRIAFRRQTRRMFRSAASASTIMHPYIYRTHDGGKTWQLITTGLPKGPVDTVREDPVRKGLLFAGTENAVWVSFDDGDHWQSLQLNLPHTSMRDLWITDNDLIVATHGRGVLDSRRHCAAARSFGEARRARHASVHVLRCLSCAAGYEYRYPTAADEPAAPESAGRRDARLLPPSAGVRHGDAGSSRQASKASCAGTQQATNRKTEDELRRQLVPLYWVRGHSESLSARRACIAGCGTCGIPRQHPSIANTRSPPGTARHSAGAARAAGVPGRTTYA